MVKLNFDNTKSSVLLHQTADGQLAWIFNYNFHELLFL